MGRVEGNWLADLLVACVCRMKGVSGETLLSLIIFFQDNGFFCGGKAFGVFFEAITHAFKERKMLVLFSLVFQVMH